MKIEWCEVMHGSLSDDENGISSARRCSQLRYPLLQTMAQIENIDRSGGILNLEFRNSEMECDLFWSSNFVTGAEREDVGVCECVLCFSEKRKVWRHQANDDVDNGSL